MTSSNHRTQNRLSPLQRWLPAIDPGMIRLQAAGRAALALLSIWLLLRVAAEKLFDRSGPPIPLFGVLFE